MWQIGLILWMVFGILVSGAQGEDQKSKRPFYEYKGNYREEINQKKEQFKKSFGYELFDLDVDWKSNEIDYLIQAFSQFPAVFYRLSGLKGFYRTGYFNRKTKENINPEEVPAATFPAFASIYRYTENTYNLFIEDDHFRIEFYDSIFNEEPEDIINIIHHEMGHALDISRGMLSVSNEWLTLTDFRVHHLAALDAQEDKDYLFTFLNNPSRKSYAPVSIRHQTTYSRQNPQEDFANSVAAYIHYPFFRVSNPTRYQFLKNQVFDNKEYFKNSSINYLDAVLSDLEGNIKRKRWEGILNLAIEVSRTYRPEVAAQVLNKIRFSILEETSADIVSRFVEASCFIIHPAALKLRRDLVRMRKITVNSILKIPRCKITGRDSFQKVGTKVPVSNLFYYREEGQDWIQFMDPAIGLAYSRGYSTRYQWVLEFAGGDGRPIAQGRSNSYDGGNGSVKLNLTDKFGKKLNIPIGRKLVLKIHAIRSHSKTFKEFSSEKTVIQFVFHPWFKYFPKKAPSVHVKYPLNLISLEKLYSKN